MKDLWKEDLDAFLEKLDVRYTMLLGYIMHIFNNSTVLASLRLWDTEMGQGQS